MSHTTILILILLAGALSPAHAACTYPQEITIPDGSTATNDEMVAGQKAVKEYMATVENYLACLENEEKEMGDSLTPEQKALHVKRHNAAVDALTTIAARFNEQVRAFKAQSK